MYLRLLYLFLLTIIIPVSVFAQLLPHKVKVEDSSQNTLYTSCINELTISSLPPESSVLFDGKALMGSSGVYTVSPWDIGHSQLSILDKTGRDVFSKTFVIERLQRPRLQFGNLKYEYVAVEEILANPTFALSDTSCELIPSIRIESCTIRLFLNDSMTTREIHAKNLIGSAVPKDFLDTIAGMHRGDRLFVEDIIAVIGPDDSLGRLRLPDIFLGIVFDSIIGSGKFSQFASFRPKLADILDIIVKHGEIGGDMGPEIAGRLSEVATAAELETLIAHENPLIRAYAFDALILRKPAAVFPIVLEHLRDTAEVKVKSGCIVSKTTILERFIGISCFPNAWRKIFSLSVEDRDYIDSILLFDSSIRFYAKQYLLRLVNPKPAYHDRIRAMVSSGQLPVAILLLAKYRDDHDTDRIKQFFNQDEYYGVCAARTFPSQAFYPLLVSSFNNNYAKLQNIPADDYFPLTYWSGKLGVLFEALAEYPTNETYLLFNELSKFKEERFFQDLSVLLLTAIHKHPSPVFAPIEASIKLDREHMKEMKENHYKETW